MPKFMRSAVVLFKVETAEGTDPVPTAPLNAILCRGITPQPITAEYAERNLIRAYFGASGQLPAAIHSEIEFEIEIAGSGAAGTAPKWAPLMLACGFAENLVATTSAVYSLTTPATKFATIHYFLDGIRHVLTGAQGSVAFDLNAKGIPVWRFKFFGRYTKPTDTATPANTDYSGFQMPAVINKDNTPSCTLFGVAVKMQSLSGDLANQLVYRNLVNSEGVRITDRSPSGSISFELGAVSEKDWWTIAKDGTLGPLSLVHGTVAGNIVKLDAPKVQLTNPQYSDSDGIAMMNFTLSFQPNTGNDELVFTTA
jgi:hypothetical protein